MARYYRLMDEALVAGVAAGLADRWNISRPGLRTGILGFFVLINLIPSTGPGISLLPLLIYTVAWMAMPARESTVSQAELEKKAAQKKAFYNFSMLGLTANLVPLLAMWLFRPDQFVLVLLTVPTFILLLPATIFIVAGIFKAG